MSLNNFEPTIGIEEEFYVNSSENLRDKNLSNISFEIFDHQIELKTGIHSSLNSLFLEQIENRKFLFEKYLGTQIIGSGTFPGLKKEPQVKINGDREEFLFRKLGHVLLMVDTCGLHVHVGIKDPNRSIEIINKTREYIPMLIAISGNSPIYQGIDTGYSSFRNVLHLLMPRTGIPPYFNDLEDYINEFNILEKNETHVNGNVYNNNWWDIRFNEKYSTIEFRMFDSQSNFNLVQLFASLSLLVILKCAYSKSSVCNNSILLNENRWRACRFGINSILFDCKTMLEKPVYLLWKEFFEECKEYVDCFEGLASQLELFDDLLFNFNGAVLQRKKLQNQSTIESVMEFQNKQFLKSCQKTSFQ